MSAQVEVAEAICSALYQMPFVEFLGEKDLPWYNVLHGEGEQPEQEARHAWFHVGEKPKDMRVTVIRPSKAELVQVRIEWRNYFADGRQPLKGEQTLNISTYAATQAMLQQPTEAAVVRVLELYRDILTESGVAGRLSDLVESEPGEEVTCGDSTCPCADGMVCPKG